MALVTDVVAQARGVVLALLLWEHRAVACLSKRIDDCGFVARQVHRWDHNGVGRRYAAAAADVQTVGRLIDFVTKDRIHIEDLITIKIKRTSSRSSAVYLEPPASLDVDDLADVVVVGRREAVLDRPSIGRDMTKQR